MKKVKVNMEKNSIAQNILHLFYSTALSSTLNAVALIILASYLHSYNYGLFSVALAFAMIMGYFTDAGLSDIVLREGSKKKADVSILISSYIKLRFILLVFTFLAGFIMINLFSNNDELVRTSYFLTIPMVTGIALQSIGTTFFQMIEKMQYYGFIRIMSALFLVSTISLGILFELAPVTISIIYGCSYLAAGVFGVILVTRRVSLRFKGPFHKALFHNLGAFTLGGLLFVLLPHLGPLVLEKTISLSEVGLFAVAYRIPQALQQIPFIVAGAYYPVLFRAFNNNRLRDHLNFNLAQIKIMALIGMGMTIPFFYMSSFVVHFLFGEQWAEAAFPLKILSLMLTFQAINIALADGLTTRGKQNTRTTIQSISILIGIILYAGFSRSYGVVGAAIAGVGIEVFSLIGFLVCIPNRWIIAKKAIIPYTLFFTSSLLLIGKWLSSYALLASLLNMLLLLVIVWLDRDLRVKCINYLHTFLTKMKENRENRRVEDGI
ncbi:oligosaccharide flippase family protein [Halobacillus andaensis]|uniref:oligosaccharide flippase family protein n=1 Tax=Halobacillus andaensis TaxID=1176239 RepID=UPI001666936C|nr:oligosaccharide flippase family protein [Halobacillus andaensis]MBP2005808.1 O-antigen/teichoic acid export membrane protein [Halobacillus andaensis]